MKNRISIAMAAAFGVMWAVSGVSAHADEPSGQELAFDNRKGNCLACHGMPGEPKAVTNTNIAPPLIAMRARFPDRRKLYDQIWDATRFNPGTAMPPFGKHQVLTESEINKIIDYIYGL